MKNLSWAQFEIAYEKWYTLHENQRLIANSLFSFDREAYVFRADVDRAFRMRMDGSGRKEVSDYLKKRWKVHRGS